MEFKKKVALLLTAALLCAAAGCKLGEQDKSSSSAASAPPPVAVDPNWPAEVGELRLEQQPARVVSLSPAMTELVFELGAGERLAGVSDFCDYPAEVSALPACGTTALPDREAIAQAKPQLVLSSTPLTQQDTVWLQQQNIAVAVFPRAGSLDALEERYRAAGILLGGMVDGQENGERTFAALRGVCDAIAAAAGRIDKPYSGIWLRGVPLMMATGETFEGTLLELLGVRNDAADYTGWEYPADRAVDLYPDVIFYDRSIDPEYFKGTQVYSTTEAYKQGRLYPFDAIVFERQSGRMFAALAEMFETLYPDLPLGGSKQEAAHEPSADALPEAQETDSSSLSGVLEEPK